MDAQHWTMIRSVPKQGEVEMDELSFGEIIFRLALAMFGFLGIMTILAVLGFFDMLKNLWDEFLKKTPPDTLVTFLLLLLAGLWVWWKFFRET